MARRRQIPQLPSFRTYLATVWRTHMARRRRRPLPRNAAAAQGRGRVALVGAGPGDPELLTLKALRKLREADVVVHDRLIGTGILEQLSPEAELISVGKTPGGPSPRQEEINRILVREARRGRNVVRLKGGDPSIFGRAEEELAALAAADIPAEVVPGITAALACAASARLPLTSRGRLRNFTILTGTADSGPAAHEWAQLARPGQAFAVYMGVRTAPYLQHRLIAAGIDPATPVTVVENGTLPGERRLDTEISALTDALEREGIRGPAIIFVGFSRTADAAGADNETPVIPFPSEGRRDRRHELRAGAA